ncbi:MAG: MFS transporter [Candidatus Levyibacteriota bacterium]
MNKQMNRQIFLLYVTVFISILGFGMVFPLFPLFAESFSATALDIGLMAATFSLAQFLTAPLLGRMSDRFGRKPIIVFSIVSSAVSYVIAAFAPNLSVLYLSRIIHGMASAGVFPIASAYIADITSKEDRAKYMGKIAGVFSFGFMFGPVIGGLLGSYGFAAAFLAAAVVSVFNLIFILAMLPESVTKKAEKLVLREGLFNFKEVYHGLRGDFGVLFFILFAWAFYISNFQVAIPLYMQNVFSTGTVGIGIFFSITGTTATIAQWFLLPMVVKRIGELKTILAGIGLMILGQFFATIWASQALFYLFFIISIMGSGLKRPTVNAVLSKATHTGQGATMGLAFSFESLGRVIGPLIAGFAIARFGLQFPFWATVVVLIVGFLLFYKVEMKRIRK